MFTGIITDTTSIKRSTLSDAGLTITFARPKAWRDMQLGESVATDGVCLTVSALRTTEYDCFLMPETLHKTSFGSIVPKTVNLERPLSVNDRFGGHFVQGHVDCIGTVSNIDERDGWLVSIEFPAAFNDLVIPKGSITINGVSLTVVSITGNTLCVALIPHTLTATTMQSLQIGTRVNLEFDMIGKYIVNIMEQRNAKSTAS
ncbi:MAG TPA: riboflavin synthase [Patescibacteria group bacterium]|nr:riboflavin synthase [Patescibacteria group bacterium]